MGLAFFNQSRRLVEQAKGAAESNGAPMAAADGATATGDGSTPRTAGGPAAKKAKAAG